MKRILLLSLLLLPIVALAQYPTFSNKQKLGVQTTGDGLIFRGGIHPNYYTPSNINNAYFYLDTIASKLYLYSVGTWQQVYPTASDTLSLGAYLLKNDTSAMLLPYLRKSDTISLSNRINNKLNATDTVSLSNRIDLKLNKTDTINLSNRIDLKLNKSDTISLSNRINIKLNASDTVSLSNRINKKLDTLYVNYQTNVDLLTNKDTINITPLEAGAGINITNNVISLDTTLLDSVVRVQNVYVKNGTGTVLNKGEAVYVTGADGTNIIVGRASNVAESSSSKTLGLTMTSIAINGFGYVIKEGLLEGLNTSAANSDGDPIWLSNTPGSLIFGLANKPYAPNHLVYLGIVTRKQQNNGEVYVTVQNGFEIKELHDVQILNPENKASLYYNSSQSLWRDTTAALLVSDTASMLSKYVNTYSNQTGINGDKTFNNVITIDSATVTGKLLVNTNISDAVKINSNTNSTNLELMNSNGTVSIKSSNKNMILQTDTTALVYLNGDNKKVGILTMNPQQELEVNGNARITGLNNNLVPTRMIGSDNNGDLTNVNLGEGLSFSNDTLKVDLTIIDTAIAASSITLTGHVTGTGSTNSTVNTTISNGVVTNDMLAGSISDTKLNTITTAGKVSNSATTATVAYPYLSQANTIVLRNSSGDFGARNIIATNFYGNATTSTSSYGLLGSLNSNEILRFKSTNSPSFSGVINMTTPNIDFNVASTNLSQTFSGTQTFSNTISGSINGNAATVTSVLPSNFASQTANTVLAAPNGSSGTPTFRLLTSTDIPSLNYLPLAGGTLSGALNGTTGTFNTRLGVGSYVASPTLFTSGSGDQEIHFTHSDNIQGRKVSLRLTNNNSGFYTYGGLIYALQGEGLNQYNRMTLGINTTEVLHLTRFSRVGIMNNSPSYTLDVNGTFNATGNSLIGGTLGVTSNITANSFIKSGGISTQFLKADGSVDANTYLTSGTAAYLPLAGGTMTGTINRAEDNYNNSPNTFYFNILNYFARRDNVKGNATAQITFTDRPGTNNFANAVRTSDIYLMTAHNWNGSAYGQYLDTTLSVVANQDGGRVGISKLNPAYKLDVNGTFNASGNSLIGGTLGVSGATNISNTLNATTGTFTGLNVNNTTTEGIITLQGFDNNTATRIQFKTTGSIRRQIVLPTSDSNLEFRTSTIGGTQGGYSFYTRRNPNAENLAFNIDVDGNSNFYGTLGVTGATTINNVLTINSGASNGLLLNGTNSQFIKVYSSGTSFANAGTWYQNATTGQTEGSDGLFVGIVGGTGSYFTNYENSKTYFRTFSNTNQLVLDTDGNVGIGIDDATAKLDVSGTLKVSGTTTLSNLGTNGTRMVVTDNNGLLSTQAIPSSGSGTVTNVSINPTNPNGLSVATPTTTPVISIALANGTSSSGVVSTGTQIFGGSKTFSSNLIVNTISVGKGNNSLAGNTVVGLNALSSTTAGTYNTAVGEVSLRDNLSGNYNTALGSNSLSLNTTGSYNTAIGQASLYSNNANHNTAVGESAAEFTIGSSNTAVGSQAMYNLTTGTDNTIIGYNSNASIVNATNQIVIGSGVVGHANNTVTIGSISGKIYNSYTTSAAWTQTSDGRLKNIIAKDSLGLSFINRLNPITYTWKPSNDLPIDNPYYNATNNKDTTTVIHGFVAQEIKAALDAENCSTFNGWVKGDDGIEGISREMFINPLVKAIQELSAQIEILKAEIKELKKQ